MQITNMQLVQIKPFIDKVGNNKPLEPHRLAVKVWVRKMNAVYQEQIQRRVDDINISANELMQNATQEEKEQHEKDRVSALNDLNESIKTEVIDIPQFKKEWYAVENLTTNEEIMYLDVLCPESDI